MEVYVSNLMAEVPPDRTTALMAAQVIGNLIGFCEDAGVAWQSARPDPARFEKLIKGKKRETAARRRRRRKQMLGTNETPLDLQRRSG
jgi:hypothetical protein